MRVLTVATDIANPFLRRLLLPSCAAVGLDLVVLRPTGAWRGYVSKAATVRKYLSGLKDRDETLCFTDAYDTLFVRGEAHILEHYRQCGSPVLFSGESNSWPLGALGFALYGVKREGRFPYLNSGGYVGRVADLLTLLGRYPEPPVSRFEILRAMESHGYDLHGRFGWSDQYYWTLVYLLEAGTIDIDRSGSVFEFFGPRIEHVVTPEIDAANAEFLRLGQEAAVYRANYARLTEALEVPSSAAQLHFAGLVTKAALFDMFTAGCLPPWLEAAAPNDVPLDVATVVDVE